jgi:hypothetical protein
MLGILPTNPGNPEDMKSKAVLEFADVKTIAAAAEAEAAKNNWAVTIAIVDDGGHLLHSAAPGRRSADFFSPRTGQG